VVRCLSGRGSGLAKGFGIQAKLRDVIVKTLSFCTLHMHDSCALFSNIVEGRGH